MEGIKMPLVNQASFKKKKSLTQSIILIVFPKIKPSVAIYEREKLEIAAQQRRRGGREVEKAPFSLPHTISN